MSSQNLITFTVNPELIAALGKTLGDLEGQLSGLVSLSIDARRTAAKMGAKSEYFCRQTLNVLRLNPKVVPPTIDLVDAESDLDALDQLRPVFQRLRRLSERAVDSELALGSDVMTAALAGYRVLKAVGRSEGLESVRRDLGASRFTGKRPPAEPAEPAMPVAPATP